MKNKNSILVIGGITLLITILIFLLGIENGKRAIPLERMIALAKYYNVSLDYLAGLIDTPRKLK